VTLHQRVWLVSKRSSAGMTRPVMQSVLMPRLRPCNGLPDFGAAIRALIDKVDFRHAPMRLNVPHIHRQQSDAAGAEDRRCLTFVVVLDVGWHVGSPSRRKLGKFQPRSTYRVRATPIINSFERTRNETTIFACVAFL
jgi:hypothetical protein